MKKIFSLLLLSFISVACIAQEFNKNLAQARTTYASGNLNGSREAMQQMLRDLDVQIGKEILKLLPSKMETMEANTKDDNVSGNGGGLGMGLYVQRSYGAEARSATLDIINNSPIINSLQGLLALPFIANSGDGTQKVVKVQGYKAVLNKMEDSESGKTDYELQIPLQNTLLSLKVDDTKEDGILKMANTIPLAKIAEMAR